MTSQGIKACEDAFQRLIDGKPLIKAHVGLSADKITAGVVSVEAGYDRGYLKKSRKHHLMLLARIASYRTQISATKESSIVKLVRAKQKIHTLEDELTRCKTMMERVLTQNMQLVETVKHLEVKLRQLQDIKHARMR